MEQLNQFLQELISTSGYELHLEPNKNPYVINASGQTDIASSPMASTQISMMVFPLIPNEIKQELPNQPEIDFVHPHNLGEFGFNVQKSPAGFMVTVRPIPGKTTPDETMNETQPAPELFNVPGVAAPQTIQIESTTASSEPAPLFELPQEEKLEAESNNGGMLPEVVSANDPQFQTMFSDTATYEPPGRRDDFNFDANGQQAPVESHPNAHESVVELPSADRRSTERRKHDALSAARMDALFKLMAEVGASDLHLSVSMPPMIRKDGKIQRLECSETELTEESMRELITSIMPVKNLEEFATRNDTDFAYEIEDLARFRCNVFRDRKGMGGVFRIIPAKMTTADQLGLSKAILDLCDLSKGLVVVTGPTGSGKSTTLCAMVNEINMQREDHIITIEDPIEFVHENIKCLVNQREVHNHTDSFKDALRAALREDPDILLVGEMRDLETISIAIETAETGHLVFGTLHTTTAASTVDRIIDQFPADRQQQIRVMLSESLKGVIAQTLLPKIGGGRVAALEVLIVTPAISNLIREGKTFQIPSAMQTGKTHGMMMLNDSLYDLVKNKIVEPKDAYIKAVDKTGFEAMLTKGKFKI
ncbi:MAG: PilT/PilU family type 4a pilus ATPase [Pyrinomonadaceae bacterium]